MNIYSEKLTLQNRDVNMFRRLCTSRLFEILEEVSIKHTELLGAGKALTLDKNILWVVTMQRAEIARMPEYGEEITVESWPGETMHVLFPRYYRVLDAEGKALINASAIWTMVNMDTRKLVFPETCGIAIDGAATGNEIALPNPPAKLETDHASDFTVPFSYVDLNGHMNNTRYFDLAEDTVPACGQGRRLKVVCSEYLSEMCLGERAQIRWGERDGRYYFSGEGEKKYFRLSLEYC